MAEGESDDDRDEEFRQGRGGCHGYMIGTAAVGIELVARAVEGAPSR